MSDAEKSEPEDDDNKQPAKAAEGSEEKVEISAGQRRKVRKAKYCTLFTRLLHEYKSILLIGIENVGSNQMAQVRMSLRGRAIFLMGKNTMIRRLLKIEAAKDPIFSNLIPHIIGNVGLVFTNDDLSEIRNAILEHKVPAAAKTGAIAPIDVWVPPGPTGMDPGQTSFFQALNIATKIMRGCIEIISAVHLVVKGEKVSASHVSLLTKLNIKPFFYGIKVLKVYESGDVFNAEVLDFSDDLVMGKFFNAVRKIAAITMEVGYPNLTSIPHIFTNAMKAIVAISLETEWMFKESEVYKDMIENPEKYGGGGSGSGSGGGGDTKEEAKEEAKEEEEEESDAGLGGGGCLFGDSDDDGDGDY